MPEIKNTFLKAKMNKDLDDRLIPNGEYRDALNLQISRSESSDVGEFETMLGNTSLAYLKLGSAFNSITGIKTYAGKVIGQYTDEANANIYTFSTAYTGSSVTPRDTQVFTGGGFPIIGATFILYDGAGNVLDPLVLGIQVGMLLWGEAIDSSSNTNYDPYVTEITNANITVSWNGAGSIASGLPFTIGWCNKIHVFNTRTQALTLLVEGGFLNFSTLNRIYGVNFIEDLLFWTDNRNQPRKINTTLANITPVDHPGFYTNDDSIAVAKYYPFETPKVLEQVTQSTTDGWFITNQPAYGPPVTARGYVLTMAETVNPNIKIGDIVTGFEARTQILWAGSDPQQEIWRVTTIGATTALLGTGLTLGANQLVVYSQLYQLPFNTPIFPITAYVRELTFSRSTQKNQGDPKNENYLTSTITQPAGGGVVIAGDLISVLFNQADGDNSFPIPQVGDLVTSDVIQGWNEATAAAVPLIDGNPTPGLDTDVRIAAITNIPNVGCFATNCRLGFTLTKDINIPVGTGDELNIGNNPDYRTDWSGDPDLLEDIFVRFSYRYKFIDNEYSLSAPFSQICFIPKQLGLFGAGQQSTVTDMDETFKTTIVNWFENRIDNINLKIPLPLLHGIGKTAQETLNYLNNNYKVKAIDILYKESDGVSIKVIDTIETSSIIATQVADSIILNTGGTGYAIVVGALTTGGIGTGLTITTTVLAGVITTGTIADPGTGYQDGDIVTVVGPGINGTFIVRVNSNINIIPGPYNVLNEDIRYYYNFDYKSTKAYKTLPEAQTTRVYDKVPVKALAQEITGNRVTYGNFLQSYTPPANINYEISVDNKAVINLQDEVYDNYTQYPNSTLKQNRNYQVGWVLGDKYGRQSAVVLSSNDDRDDVNGSSFYAPYKSYGDVQALSTYEWLGDIMRMRINSGVSPTLANNTTGEPGTQKPYENTTVDGVAISVAGTNYPIGPANTSYNFALTGEGPGLGSGLTVDVVSADPGPITGIKIINPGTGYADGQLLRVDGGNNDAIIQITVNPPNVLGWYSYKLVVKQQEQEYYNVYFPGFTRGWPNTGVTSPGAPAPNHGNEAGETSFATLLSDNIQKVPRNLREVGPKDQLFNSGVKLYGRINNPDNINEAGTIWDSIGEPWNCQYYPGRIGDEVTTIGLIGFSGFEIANSPFDSTAIKGAFNNNITYPAGGAPPSVPPQLPFDHIGVAAAGGANQAFYGVESNPLAIQIGVGSKENQPNLQQLVGPTALGIYTLGALVTDTGAALLAGQTASMRPFLSVSETVPTESLLALFWETGDTGDLVALNRLVNNDYAGVVSSELGGEAFPESTAPLTNITPVFGFLDAAGSQITSGLTVPTWTVTDGTGANVTGQFELVDSGGGNFVIRTSAGTYFWYGITTQAAPLIGPTGAYTIVFHTNYIDGAGDTYLDTITGSSLVLTNVIPTITSPNCGGAYPGAYDVSQVEFYTYTAVNGSLAAGSQDTTELFYELMSVIFTPLIPATTTNAEFGWDLTAASGVLKVINGTLELGDYLISVRVHDTTDTFGVPGVGTLVSADCNITFTVGYPHAPKAICAGSNPGIAKPACTESIEYYFGSENYANSTASGTISVFPSSGIAATQFYNVKTTNYNPAFCGAPWPANYTTAALDEGGITITITFAKQITLNPVNFSANYTILYRPTSLSPWDAATPIGAGTYISPTSPGSPIDITTGRNVSVTGAIADAITPEVYNFDDIGEYAVICNVIGGSGCGLYPTDIAFEATWGDLYYPAVGCELVCSGKD